MTYNNSEKKIKSKEQNLSDKNQLEVQKLRREIDILNRPWFKNPSYLQIILPAIIAIVSLYYAASTGLFDKKFETLKLEKATLAYDIKTFETVKNNLIAQKDSAIQVKDSLTVQVENLKIQIAALQKNNPHETNLKINYDKNGNIIETITKGNKIFYIYDANNRLIRITDSIGNITRFTYDNLGRIVRFINPQGKVTTYTYNNENKSAAYTTKPGKIQQLIDSFRNQFSIYDPRKVVHQPYMSSDNTKNIGSKSMVNFNAYPSFADIYLIPESKFIQFNTPNEIIRATSTKEFFIGKTQMDILIEKGKYYVVYKWDDSPPYILLPISIPFEY